MGPSQSRDGSTALGKPGRPQGVPECACISTSGIAPNGPENRRPIPPGDPDFEKIFPLRVDAESINRGLEDSLYLRRAHSVGRARQHLNLIGWALTVNSLTRAEHRARPPDTAAA